MMIASSPASEVSGVFFNKPFFSCQINEIGPNLIVTQLQKSWHSILAFLDFLTPRCARFVSHIRQLDGRETPIPIPHPVNHLAFIGIRHVNLFWWRKRI